MLSFPVILPFVRKATVALCMVDDPVLGLTSTLSVTGCERWSKLSMTTAVT